LKTQRQVKIIIPGIFSFSKVDSVIKNAVYAKGILFATGCPIAQAALVKVNT